MKAKAYIRQQFQVITESVLSFPQLLLLRKATVSVKKGKITFSTEQLLLVKNE